MRRHSGGVRSAGSFTGVRARVAWSRGGAEPAPAGQPDSDPGGRHGDRVTAARIGAALDALDIRYLTDGDGDLLAVWERHAMLFAVEGPEDEILVMRSRSHATVPAERAERAYRIVNQWNHTHRFGKAYVGDPLPGGRLPIHAEVEVPLDAGVHEALLVELVHCGTAVATSFVDWLHDEAGLV